MHVFERQKWTFLNSDLMQNCLRRPYKIQGSDYIKGSLYVRGNNSTVSLLEMPCRPKFDKNPELYFDECIKANKVLLNRFQKKMVRRKVEFRPLNSAYKLEPHYENWSVLDAIIHFGSDGRGYGTWHLYKIPVWNRNAWLNYTSVLAKGLEILQIKTIS